MPRGVLVSTDMQRVTEAFKARLADNVVAAAQRIRGGGVPFYLALPDAMFIGLLTQAFEAAARDLEAGGAHTSRP